MLLILTSSPLSLSLSLALSSLQKSPQILLFQFQASVDLLLAVDAVLDSADELAGEARVRIQWPGRGLGGPGQGGDRAGARRRRAGAGPRVRPVRSGMLLGCRARVPEGPRGDEDRGRVHAGVGAPADVRGRVHGDDEALGGGQGSVRPGGVQVRGLARYFWARHDPNTLNRPGNDVGTQYRSGIYFYTPEQEKAANESLERPQKSLNRMIVTEILPAKKFYRAEEYHQQYLAKGGRFGCRQSAEKGCNDPIHCYG